jgi:intraflagellar transport protein 122
LQVIAQHFRKSKHLSYAKEAYLKLADMKNLIGLYIEMEKWEEALLLGK